MSQRTIIRLGETSLERRGRSPWKELVPKEHGVWAWLALPLIMALGLAPAPSTLLGGLAVVAGFAAAQGFGRALKGSKTARVPTLLAVVAANALGAASVATAAAPEAIVATLLGGALAGFGTMALMRGRAPREVVVELVAIAGFIGIGAGLAMGGAADGLRVLVGAAALGAWLVSGLWWVKAALARVLSHRRPWAAGRWFSAAAIAVSILVGYVGGHVVVGLLPVVYGVRIAVHRAPREARDAKRVGLTELAWGLVVAVLAGVLP